MVKRLALDGQDVNSSPKEVFPSVLTVHPWSRCWPRVISINPFYIYIYKTYLFFLICCTRIRVCLVEKVWKMKTLKKGLAEAQLCVWEMCEVKSSFHWHHHIISWSFSKFAIFTSEITHKMCFKPILLNLVQTYFIIGVYVRDRHRNVSYVLHVFRVWFVPFHAVGPRQTSVLCAWQFKGFLLSERILFHEGLTHSLVLFMIAIKVIYPSGKLKNPNAFNHFPADHTLNAADRMNEWVALCWQSHDKAWVIVNIW